MQNRKVSKKQKRRDGQGITITPLGFVILFFMELISIEIAIAIYRMITSVTEDNFIVTIVMFAVSLSFAAVCVVVDWGRRKVMAHKPVQDILRATDKIAAGDFSVRIPLRHPYGKYDSYDLIEANINRMAEELGKSELVKNDFVSNVSHELKTPLAVIRSYASLLTKPGLDAEKKERCIKTLISATDRLSDLVTDVLQLSKLENSRILPEKQECDLTALVSEEVLKFEDAVEKKRITLECDLQDVKAYACPAYMQIVVGNLLSNAVKFTEAEGSIFVSLKASQGDVVLSVRDTGCGIDPETGNRIFEKFYQGDTSHAAEGNGLGLALVKRVIDVLGGNIAVESTPGEGSTFTVTLRNSP